MNRKQFVGCLVAGAAASAMLGVDGCNLGSAIAQLEKWVPVGLQAFAGVVAIINPAAGTALAISVTVAKALWTDISTAIANYNAAPASAKTTVMAKITTALGALMGGLGDILHQLGSAASSQLGTITAALNLFIATLSAIDANLGGTPPVVPVSARVKAATSGPDFRNQFNAIVSQGGYPQFAI